jgi:hypothetical protein
MLDATAAANHNRVPAENQRRPRPGTRVAQGDKGRRETRLMSAPKSPEEIRSTALDRAWALADRAENDLTAHRQADPAACAAVAQAWAVIALVGATQEGATVHAVHQ